MSVSKLLAATALALACTPAANAVELASVADQLVATNMPDLRVRANGELAGLRDYAAAIRKP
jgi:hypothetical protein